MGMRAISQKLVLVLPSMVFLFLAQGCSYREALRGKHENQVGSHQVTIIRPCGLFTENTTRIENLPGRTKYEYVCGETKVTIGLKDNELTVNGQSYGAIKEGDSITFDHGKVLVGSQETPQVASK